jgi:WD40 repeat protein
MAFSPDGQSLASASSDETVILWDVATGLPIGRPLSGHTDVVWGVAFSPDGKTLASAGQDKTVILWNIGAESLIERTCQRVGRNLTRAEWAQYVPDEPYSATCPQWPIDPEATPIP